MNFEFWINGKLSKGAKILLSKSIFCVKSHPNLSHFFSLKNTNLEAHFLLLTFFKALYFLEWRPFFDGIYTSVHKTLKKFIRQVIVLEHK